MKTMQRKTILKSILIHLIILAAFYPAQRNEFIRVKKLSHFFTVKPETESNFFKDSLDDNNQRSKFLSKASQDYRNSFFRKKYDLELGPLGDQYDIFTTSKKIVFISGDKANEARAQYLSQQKSYDYKKNWGLMKTIEEKTHYTQISSFGDYYARIILDYQIESNLEKAEKGSEEVRAVRNVQKQVENIIQGTTEVSVSDEMKIGTHSNLPDRRGALFVTSSIINASVDANFGENAGSDKYSVSVNRSVPFVNINSSVVYGTQSTKLNASISRPIYKNVTAQFSHVRGLDQARSGLQGDTQETLQLNYGVSF